MGMDLSGAGGYFRWTASAWGKILDLAEQHGWQSVGTGAPRGTLKEDWSGSYFSNDGQLFYARDAQKLASALGRALEEIPTEKLKQDNSNWLFTSEGKESLRKFIIFCREGSFRLH